jgi:tetratricopeptide (TPR) repeat protein
MQLSSPSQRAWNAVAQACLRWQPTQRASIEFVALALQCIQFGAPLDAVQVHSCAELVLLCELHALGVHVALWWHRAPDASLSAAADDAQSAALEAMLPAHRAALAACEAARAADEAACLARVAIVCEALGHTREALALYERVVLIREASIDLLDVASSVDACAAVLSAQHDHAAALCAYERSLRLREAAVGVEHALVAASLDRVGDALFALGRYDDDDTRAIGIETSNGADSTTQTPTPTPTLAMLMPRHARAAYERAHDIRVESDGALAPSHDRLAAMCVVRRDYEHARYLYSLSLEAREMTHGPLYADVAASLEGLARVHFFRAEYADARALCVRALAIREAALGTLDVSVSATLMQLGLATELLGNLEDAVVSYGRALAIRERAMREQSDHPLLQESRRCAQWCRARVAE